MKEIFTKLTHAEASRYDRGGPVRSVGAAKNMAESSTALLEPQVKPEVREFWDGRIKEEKDANARSVMASMRRGNYVPTGNAAEKIQEEMDAQSQAIKEKLAQDQRPGFKFEEEMEKYIQIMKENKYDELPGESMVPGKVLIKNEEEEGWRGDGDENHSLDVRISHIKADWSEFGWSNTDIKNKAKLLATQMDMSLDQTRTVLEMLVAAGKTAGDITEESVRAGLQRGRRRLTATEGPEKMEYREKIDIGNDERVIYLTEIGIELDHIKKYLFYDNEYFAEANDRAYDDYPKNTEELAWQIMQSPDGTYRKWGPTGEFPLLEMRVEKQQDGSTRGRYYINQANMTLWVRERMMAAYDLDPDVKQQFFGSVKLTKRFPLSLGDMFGSPGNYFNSEDGKTKYTELYNEWIKEAWALGTLRSWDAEYRNVMGDSAERLKVLGAIFKENTLTKFSFNKNLISLLSTLSLDFKGSEKGELVESDNLLGAAANEIYLAYDSLSDFESLREILGEGSSFFTRNGWMTVFRQIIADKVKASGEEKIRATLTPDKIKEFEKAFDKNGEISTVDNSENFIKFVNSIFQEKMANGNLELAVREALKASVAEKYGTLGQEREYKMADKSIVKERRYTLKTEQGKDETYSLKMAEVIAWSMTRIFGAAAKNDVTGAGYDFGTKIGHFQTYRTKAVGNADRHGNRYTIPQFKMLTVDVLRGIATNSAKKSTRRDEKGEPVYDQKTPLEVMHEMQRLMSGYNLGLKKLERELEGINREDKSAMEAKKQKIREFKGKMAQAYQDKAGELEFRQKALSNYYDDHLSAAQKVYDMILKAEEVEMEKYVTYEAWGGVSFNREKFQEEVQDNMIHTMRYFIKTYPDINYNMRIKTLDQTASMREKKPVHREMALGEAMFGHELLNREQFWKRDPKTGKPINKLDGKGRKMKGIYKIDYDKLMTDDGKKALWKQFFMTKLAADLWAHRSYHSSDQRFDLNYYNNVIKAIESIPAGITGDEYDMRKQISTKNFFDKQDMAWFKKNAKIENYDLFLRAFFKDILLPDEKEEGIGLVLALSIFSRAIIQQGS
jgi:hypothetical protein